MRFGGIKIHNIGTFRGDVEVDIDGLPGKLIALTGVNGSGKTTLAELLMAGLHRETPTHGSLLDLAQDRDSSLEVRFTNGATHTLRHVLDGVSKKSEALILDDTGAPVLTTTSVRAFDDWAKAHLPSADVMLSSVFGAQQHGGFCALAPRGRKEVLAKVLGIEELEGIAERARKRANEAREALAAIAGELRALPELDAAATAAALDAARAESADADSALASARALQEAATTYRAKQAALTADRLALQDVETRIANNRLCLGNAEQIRAAVTRTAEIEALIADLRRDATIGKANEEELDRAGRQARERKQRAADAIRAASAKADGARDRLAARDEVQAAIDALPSARHHVDQAELDLQDARGDVTGRAQQIAALERSVADASARATRGREAVMSATAKAEEARRRLAIADDVEKAQAALPLAKQNLVGLEVRAAEIGAELKEIQASMLGAADERIAKLRESIVRIVAKPEHASFYGTDAIAADDLRKAAQETAPARARVASERVAEIADMMKVERVRLADLERTAARHGETVVAARDLADAVEALKHGEAEIAAGSADETRLGAEILRLQPEVANARELLATRENARRSALEHLSRIERAAARAGEIEAADRELTEARAAIEQAKGDEAMSSADALRLTAELEAAIAAGRALAAKVVTLGEERDALAPLVKRAAPLADAETKIAAYEPRAEELRAKVAAVETEIAALPEPLDVDVFGAERRSQQAHATIGRLEGEAARAEETARRRAELEGKRAEVESDVADWALLGDDLGASGLPALLIDAAGPELTELTNDLLHTCHGNRFTVTIPTTRSSSDGKRQIETCEVRVLDTEKGRDAPVETYSGGERVILGEAVALALSMIACRRVGAVAPTLVRDETGAALDEANARVYVRMLRRAGELVGASKTIFISHSREMQELADARIVVADGKVSVS